jgi:hypothetical protein
MSDKNAPLEIIDAEFTVISDGRPGPVPKLATWSLWNHHFPTIDGVILGMIAVAGVEAFFRANHWYG